MRIYLLIYFSVCTLLYSCGTLTKSKNESPDLDATSNVPTKNVQRVLDYIETNELTESDSVFFPELAMGIMYQGSNQTGKEFSEYTYENVKNLSADGYHTLSVQNLKNGNYSHSYKYISKAAELDPKEYAGYFGWTLLYYYRDYKNALKYLETYDAFTPNFSDFPAGENIHYLKGLAYMQLNELDSACSNISRYINEETEAEAEDFIDVYAFVNRGNILFKMNKMEESILDYKKALHFSPDNLEALYFLSLAELKLGQKESAKQNLNKALEFYHKDKRNRDVYIEYFHAVYESDIINLIKSI